MFENNLIDQIRVYTMFVAFPLPLVDEFITTMDFFKLHRDVRFDIYVYY